MNKTLCRLSLALALAAAAPRAMAQTESLQPHCRVHNTEIDVMIRNLEFDEAQAALNKQLGTGRRKKPMNEEQQRQNAACEAGRRALQGTDRVTILDSIVVSKAEFLKAYRATAEVGTFRMSADGSTVDFTTERGNQTFRVEPVNVDGDTLLQICSYYVDGELLTERNVLTGLDVDGDLNYPFMQTDGQTFYFAARTDEGLGNYDLYVTRYDSESKQFFRAENMGFPYNSYANDYMMVIDESLGIGWFASDRFQPADRVCIYTFVPNESRQTYDYDTTDRSVLRRAASLSSVASMRTPEVEQQRIKLRQRLALLESAASGASKHEFTLVLNDNFTYHYASQFQNSQAREKCAEWLRMKARLAEVDSSLSALRDRYAQSSAAQRSQLSPQILQLESEQRTLIQQVYDTENLLRKLELNR